MTQGSLPLDPEPSIAPAGQQRIVARAPRLNPTAPSERYKGLQRKCLLVLGRLQQGPATNAELVSIGGLRYGARLAELRDAGHKISTQENRRTGLTVYTLEAQG